MSDTIQMTNMYLTPDLVIQIHFVNRQKIYNCSNSNLSFQYMMHRHAISINYKKARLVGRLK